MQGLISFVLPVRDRDNKRIQRCVDSLQSEFTKEVIIVDYGSKIPIKKIKGVKIIRYDKNKIWNKPHAINIGIKQAKADYVSSVDCDMIISSGFIEAAVSHLYGNSFIYSINVKRIKTEDVSSDFNDMLEKSWNWNENSKGRYSIIHNANGGIQIYPKKWISDVGGVDESLVYWGGMDNDVFERAILSGLTVINLNIPILHQEHKFKKEENLPKGERGRAMRLRIERMRYLEEMLVSGDYTRNNGHWGEYTPNQEKFLQIENELIKKEKERIEKKFGYQNAFVQAVKDGKNSFMFDGKEWKVFR